MCFFGIAVELAWASFYECFFDGGLLGLLVLLSCAEPSLGQELGQLHLLPAGKDSCGRALVPCL